MGEKSSDGDPFCQKIQDQEYRRKFFHTLILFLSVCFLGIQKTQHFTAFLDLAEITGTNVEQASVFYTAMSVGILLGTFSMGIMFDKLTYHRLFLLVSPCILGAVTHISIPWSTNYLLTIFLFFINSFCEGSFDNCVNASLMSIWGVQGKMFMQFLHFSLSIGTIISPFTVQPFLSKLDSRTTSQCPYINFSSQLDQPSIIVNGTMTNISNLTLIEPYTITSECVLSDSRIHYAYLLGGSLFLTAGILLSIEGCMSRVKSNAKKHDNEDHRNPRTLPMWLNVLVLALISAMYLFLVGCVKSVIGYVMAFSVNGLGWDKIRGSQLSSVFWAGYASSRLLCVFIIRWVKPGRIILSSNSVILISLGGLWLSVIYDTHWGVWACMFLTASGLGVIFPTGIIYIENDIMKFTGKVAAVIWISGAVQGFINPPLLGYLMQEVSFKWYIYMAVIEGGLCFLSFGIMELVVKRVVSKLDNRNVTFNFEMDVLSESNVKERL